MSRPATFRKKTNKTKQNKQTQEFKQNVILRHPQQMKASLILVVCLAAVTVQQNPFWPFQTPFHYVPQLVNYNGHYQPEGSFVDVGPAAITGSSGFIHLFVGSPDDAASHEGQGGPSGWFDGQRVLRRRRSVQRGPRGTVGSLQSSATILRRRIEEQNRSGNLPGPMSEGRMALHGEIESNAFSNRPCAFDRILLFCIE